MDTDQPEDRGADRVPSDGAGYAGRTRRLFALYRQGDRDAERALFEEHGDHLLRLVRRRLPRGLRSQVDPEDVVGDVFRRALNGPLARNEWTDETPGGLRALLAHVARGVLVDLARYHGAGQRAGLTVSLDDERAAGSLGSGEPSSVDTSQTSHASYAELLELGREALSAREWELFEAVVIQGGSAAEVALERGENPGAIRGVLFRARQKLIARLARGGEA